MNQSVEKKPAIKEADVIAYLQADPDFFLNHDDLLTTLNLPHHESGSVVSLIERQVGIMREEKSRSEQQFKVLHQTAQNNEHLLKRLQHLIILLIQSDSLEQSISYLRSALLDDFHADSAVVKIYDPGLGQSKGIDDDLEDLKVVQPLIAKHTPFCGSLTDAQRCSLFGKNGSEIASAVIIPLPGTNNSKAPLGLVAIGSIDPARYSPDMGTIFINHLGAVINAIFIAHMER